MRKKGPGLPPYAAAAIELPTAAQGPAGEASDRFGSAMEKPLTPAEIKSFRERLEVELTLHAREVEVVEERVLEPSGGARFQEDDEALEEEALDVELTALETQARLGEEIREALARIEARRFGLCEACRRPIPLERLELVPHARRCAPCEQDRSPHRGRP